MPGLIERLQFDDRDGDFPLSSEAADALEKLSRYATHKGDCKWYRRNIFEQHRGKCDCGLTALLKELDDE